MISAGVFAKPLNTIEPTNPAKDPPIAASTIAATTLSGGLNPNGAKSPGIGDAVQGALLIMPSIAAASPASPPPKKFDP